jgi:hypothetical protein
MALTAKHVLDELLPTAEGGEIAESLSLLQIYREGDEHEYAVWDVVGAILHPDTDLAVLKIDPDPRISGQGRPPWGRLVISPLMPTVGQAVAGFGYRRSAIALGENSNGGPHVDLTDEPMVGVGTVQELHEAGRDPRYIHYPSFRVDAPFARGMSGGPVFDESGALCGIISRGMERPDGRDTQADATEYAAAIWPVFSLNIGTDRPRSAYDLVTAGLIEVDDVGALREYLANRASK